MRPQQCWTVLKLQPGRDPVSKTFSQFVLTWCWWFLLKPAPGQPTGLPEGSCWEAAAAAAAALDVGEVIHRGSASWSHIKDFSGALEGGDAEAAELQCPRGGRVCNADCYYYVIITMLACFLLGFWNNLSYF